MAMRQPFPGRAPLPHVFDTTPGFFAATQDYDRLAVAHSLQELVSWQAQLHASLDRLCMLCSVNKISSSGAG